MCAKLRDLFSLIKLDHILQQRQYSIHMQIANHVTYVIHVNHESLFKLRKHSISKYYICMYLLNYNL